MGNYKLAKKSRNELHGNSITCLLAPSLKLALVQASLDAISDCPPLEIPSAFTHTYKLQMLQVRTTLNMLSAVSWNPRGCNLQSLLNISS